MNLSRLMILGLLSERGPMHGHQVRRTSELTNAETWGGITAGALYGELRRLAAEGLIRTVRTEQVGRHPTRTIYEITEEGRLELTVQREAALDQIPVGPDAVTVVLLFANGGRLGDLRRRLGERRAKVVAQLEAMRTERRRLEEQGILGLLEVGAFRRGEYRLEAELIWQSEFDRQLSDAERATALRVVPDLRPTPGQAS
jgi:DNA-binding PadR family transcriptional regulator